ncbi:hypothetical protein QO200_13985 [Flavobacterium sp. Arc3]|uniref:hypothetical protein n=1 Tax=Flavobacterium sp. Arc3 TaxID=3046686 RepID=UPI00352C2DA6
MHQIIYPNLEDGHSESLEEYILQICHQHKTENRAMAFAFIVSDLDDPQIIKLLRDKDYLQALNKISSRYLTVFYLNNDYVDETINKAGKSDIIRFEFGIERVDAPGNYSPKYLVQNLLNRENLPSPSILFFQVIDNIITDHTFAQIREDRIEDAFIEMKQIIKTAIESLSTVKDENRENSSELFNLLKLSIESSEYWKNARNNFDKLIKIKDFLLCWKI